MTQNSTVTTSRSPVSGPATLLCAVVIDDNQKRFEIVREGLAGRAVDILHLEMLDETAATVIAKHAPDILIIDADTPDSDTLSTLRDLNSETPVPVVMFTNCDDSDVICEAVAAGVSAFVVDGLSVERVGPVVDVAVARFSKEQGLQAQLADLQQNLADRKTIERAKGLIMSKRDCREDEAYHAMRRMAMDRNLKLVDVARGISAASDLLG